jgi:hypothetical protein
MVSPYPEIHDHEIGGQLILSRKGRFHGRYG